MRWRFLAVALAAWTAAAAAHADGAFPASMGLFLPAHAPDRILLASNFGLLLSDDAGKTFHYVCEKQINGGATTNVSQYQLGPDGSVYAIFFEGLSRSADLGCSWSRAAGLTNVPDAFPDPTDAATVYALSVGQALTIRVSKDGGRTFQGPLYSTPEQLFGVEAARSSPGTVYSTEFDRADDGGASRAFLLRSSDGGANWARHEVAIDGATPALLLGVDPEDANLVYLRIAGATGDSLVITRDGGLTFSRELQLSLPFTAFLRAANGTLYVAANGELWSRPAGAASFTKFPTALAYTCLGERDGRLYACAASIADPFNLGYSDDGGKTFQPLLRFSQLRGPVACLERACAADWERLKIALQVTPPPGGSCGCGSPSGAGLLAVLVALSALRRKPRASR